MTNISAKLKSYLFSPRFHFNRFQFNLVAIFFVTVGLVAGSYFTLKGIRNIFALNDTTQTWTFNAANASGFTYTAADVTVDDSGGRPKNKILNSTFDTDLTSWSEVPSYALNDQFTTDRAAGAVNGTSAEPTGGTRTVVDTNGKLSISGSQLSFATGGAGYGDPGLWYPVVTRGAGKMLIAKINATTTTNDDKNIGWDNNQSTQIGGNGILEVDGGLYSYDSGSWPYSNGTIGGISAATDYLFAVILRSTGAYHYIRGGAYTNWTLLWVSNLNSTASLYPAIGSMKTTAVFTSDNIRIPTSTWLPTPLAYDTFTRADGAIGNSETTGPDSQTTPSLAWSGGAISTNKNVITPSLGSDVITNGNFSSDEPPGTAWTRNTGWTVSGGLGVATSASSSIYEATGTVGSWYQMTFDVSGYSAVNIYAMMGNNAAGAVGSAIAANGSYMRIGRQTTNGNQGVWANTGTTLNIDNMIVKPLTLSSLFSSVSTSDADVIADANVTLTAGTQAGLVLNLDSTSSPANFIIVYHDGTSVKVDEAVAGVYTNKQTTTVTYSAGATLRAIREGTKLRVYYNNALVGAELTMTANTNTKHGLFSTYSGNSFDNFTLWPRGSGTTKFTDAPFEELTATRDTGTKYAGSASAKLVAGGTDNTYLQSLNVGDGDSYVISAYAYEGAGVTVDTNDLNIYFDGAVQNTTFTSVGSDWYKMTATVTGANSAKDFGVRVKAGKTIYLDSFGVIKTTNQAIYNTTSYSNVAVASWDSFASSETTPTGTSIKYQVCTDDGSTCESGGTWKYYTGGVWTTANNITSHFNTAGELTEAAMQALPVTTKKISVKTILITDGVAIPSIASITVGLTTDVTDPITNASSLAMTKTNGGASISSNGWTNDLSPYFSWTAGADNAGGVGLKGYCLYVGIDSAGDPATAKGLLGTSPVSLTGTTCQFIVSSTSIDLATLAYRGAPWLTTSSSSYYLNIKAVDDAGNVFPTLTSFRFNYDAAVPTNVSYISCASGNFSNVADMNFSWPITGSAVATDDNSAISGWQYQINSTAGSWNSLTTGSSRTLTSGTDGSAIVSGNNIVYFRSVDTPGNLSSDATIRTCNLAYGGAAPQFGGTDTVTVTPSTSTSNSYALSWPAATATSGQTVTHYYYMINTSVPSTLATLQGNASTYVDNSTSLTVSAAALPNVNKGTNTVYVVAIDNASTPNYSPSNYISGTFTLSSTDPDNVGSLVSSDSSIKASSQWNVTLTWVAPTYQGAGNLTYLVKRSTDNSTFTQVGTTSGLSYVDTTPSSAKYYYKVYSKDGADAQSSGTNAVSITPTGKWTSAPTLDSGPTAGSITTKKATITWGTSRSSDSKIQYGTTSGSYSSDEVSNSSQVSSHTVNLTNLKAGTTYYYKAKWTDEDGNTGTSDEKSFSTNAAPTVKDVLAKSIGLTTTTIQYTSKDASKVKIYYGTTTSFGGSKEVSTSTSETTYTTELTGLSDGTKYYYKINTFDSDSTEYEGTTLDFATLPRPKISNVRLQQVANTAQSTILVTWTTNTEVSSIVTYYPEGKTGDARDEVNVALTKGDHRMIVRGLLPQTDYLLVVKGRDKIGNEASSDSQRLTTATDTRPPQIADLHVEGSNIPAVTQTAQEQTAQLIVSWNTDEPATSQVEFGEGTGTTYAQKTQEDSNLTFNHIVIISNLTPSKVYHLRSLSKDKVGNIGNSIDTVTITPKATENALNLVIINLQGAFGFLGGLKK